MATFSGRSGSARFGTRTSAPRGSYQKAGTFAYLRGADELRAALARLQSGMDDEAMAQATLAGAEVLAEAWSERVPVEDGDYKNGITAEASPGKVGATAVVYPGEVPGLPENEQPRNYAARLEFGSLAFTKKQATSGKTRPGRQRRAQPSLRPAYDANAGQMVAAMETELRAIIEANT